MIAHGVSHGVRGGEIREPRRGGTASVEHISFIKLDIVSPQKLNELLLERPGLVMFILMFEVPYDIRGS